MSNPRIRDLGYSPGQDWLSPGPLNSITDVPGVEVGVVTLKSGTYDPSKPNEEQDVVRSGVTVIQPRAKDGVWIHPVFGRVLSFNGAGELTGAHWINEHGWLETPIAITGTTAVGTILEGATKYFQMHTAAQDQDGRKRIPHSGLLGVVGETLDLLTNPIFYPVKSEHFKDAIDDIAEARERLNSAPRPASEIEGSRGGGTPMRCLGFKGGNGTSSRTIAKAGGGNYTLGAFVQSNFGIGPDFVIRGVPVGKQLAKDGFFGQVAGQGAAEKPASKEGEGSIIVVLATDAPFVPHQLERLLRRIPLGLARVGCAGHSFSGDIGIAFSTQQTIAPPSPGDIAHNPRVASESTAQVVDYDCMNLFFYATADVVEEAVLNALCAGNAEVGFDGLKVPGFPHEHVKRILKRAGVVE